MDTIKYLGAEFAAKGASASAKCEIDEDKHAAASDGVGSGVPNDACESEAENDECGSDRSALDDHSENDDVPDHAGLNASSLLRKRPAERVETREKPQFWFQPTEVW